MPKTLLQVRSRQTTASKAASTIKKGVSGQAQPAMNVQSQMSFSQLNAAPLSNESASKAVLHDVPSAAGLGSLVSVDSNKEAQ